jgi:hypothetical protein
MTPQLAAPLLRCVLEGLDALFAKTKIVSWRKEVLRVAAAGDATIAAAYQDIARGSAPGTFHDLIISVRNGHGVTEAQEPFVNELLATLQSMGMAAATGRVAFSQLLVVGGRTPDDRYATAPVISR